MPSINELENMKLNSLDPILTSIVATRVIYHRRLRTRDRYEPVIQALTPLIKKRVNPSIISTITNGQNDLDIGQWHSRSSALYLPEDEVRSELRKLIVFFHGPSEHRFIKRLTETCLNVIANLINSDEVTDEFHTASKKALAA